MSKRNVMMALNQTPDGSLPKNPFDLSHYEFNTTKMGQLVPVGCIETIPDADYDVGVDNYTFTLPCNTASLGKMKENFYFLWVPYSQIINSSYSFFTNRKDLQSALDYNDQKVPYFNLGDVVYRCVAGALEQLDGVTFYNDIHGFNVYEGALRVLDMLGYGCYLDFLDMIRNNDLTLDAFSTYCTNVLNKKKPNILRIAAYQKAWYCYFRNPIFDEMGTSLAGAITPRSFNFDDVTYHVAGQSESYDVMAHRSIDNFIFECLQLRYVGYKKDIFTGFMPGTQYGAVSSLTLGAGVAFNAGGNVSGTTGSDADRWSRGTIQDTGDYTDLESGSVQMTRWYSDDFVHNLAVVDNSDPDAGDWRYINHNHTFSTNLVSISGTISQGTTLFDVLQLVEAQAVQKWKQKSMMAGQRSINQYRAHFGVVPRHMEDHYPDFLGSVDNDILIDRVVANANTASDTAESTNLGDLGGRGYGASNQRTFHCHSTEHGVIIVLRAIIPENLYSSYGLDRANQLINMTDFWIPEYQNIGLEAIPKWNFDANINDTSNPSSIHPDSEDWGNTSQSFVLGYAPRNYQLKQYPSKVHGRLNPTRLLKFSPTGYLPYGFSDLQQFVLPRLDLQASINVSDLGVVSVSHFALTRKLFYVSPSIANSCFMVDADSTEATDVFIHKCRLICPSVSPCSVLGMPQF